MLLWSSTVRLLQVGLAYSVYVPGALPGAAAKPWNTHAWLGQAVTGALDAGSPESGSTRSGRRQCTRTEGAVLCRALASEVTLQTRC